MNIFKKLLGIAPKLLSDGSFSPSPLALKLATSPKTDFDGAIYESPYKGGKHRVLMVCTEETNLTMANGKTFSTGNHPVEIGLPMLHLLKAGFDIDIVTPTGKPAKIERWAMPEKDEAVKKLYLNFKEKFEKPGSLADVVKNSLNDDSPYIAAFIPGGHGAMLGLPESLDLNKLLNWVHQKNRYTLAICHGPAALLAASLDSDKDSFIYRDYTIAAFPDSVDKQTPMIGYMPGHMPWFFGERLQELGINIINKKADATCHIDRKLITGASPKAANAFGRLAANTLLDSVNSEKVV
jgi:molecular chaperone Hsp31 and glyoxalase 3